MQILQKQGDLTDARRAIRAATSVFTRTGWGYFTLSKRAVLRELQMLRGEPLTFHWTEDEIGGVFLRTAVRSTDGAVVYGE